MSKYCGKCGLQMADDDFLCPQCGAIWGDRVYRVPVISEEPELEVQEETEIAPTKVTRHHWLPVVIAICAVLLATLLLLTDWDFGAGERGTENTTIPQTSTTLPPQVSIPSSVPPSVIKKYTVRFVNAAGEGVPGVEVEYTHGNPLLSVLTLKDTTDEGGYVTFYYQGSAEPFVYILSIPDGYSRLSIKNYYRYSDGVKDLVIVLQSEATYHNYKVDMLDPHWLAEPMDGWYFPGAVVQCKIAMATDVAYMMFMNGTQLQPAPVDGGLVYEFVMPEEEVVLDLKVITDMKYLGLLADYYRQYPDKEDVSVLFDYGEYNEDLLPCEVVLLKTGTEDSESMDLLVAGYYFPIPSGNEIWVYRNNQFYDLHSAYLKAYLTEIDLQQIYQMHSQCFPELYEDYTTPAYDNPD